MAELWEVLSEHFPEFSSGFWVTVRLVAISFVIAMVVGTAVAALRDRPAQAAQLARRPVYVEMFRNIPLLVLLFISFAGLRRAGLADRRLGRRHRAASGSTRPPTWRRRSDRGVRGREGPDRGVALARPRLPAHDALRIVLPQAFRTVIPHARAA